ncbi:microtubule-associated protein 1B isoform X3 [Zophobas morio]|uniref:microtubule-associated protein 1B isoform X3 n=1 Tax=Zophobas morio TaxID=2755281 RepID=UPI00308364E0
MQRSISLYNFNSEEYDLETATKRKFWNPRKWFKRKNKAAEDVIPVDIVEKDDLRSRSTSELSITDDQIRRSRSGSSMPPGLSVSHDSVFHSPNSGSDIELDAAQSSSSLSISQPQIDSRLQTELSERLRLRRGRGDTSEDDEGLPHSPCNSPTTTEALLDKTAIKDLPTKSHSTCSDGSLLSMGSSEMDEESFSQSRHSSKLSLQEKRSSDQDSDFELGPSSSSTPLNHSAAHHRVSVRPKRRAPHRNKRVPQLSNALPTTPEVNEESSIRSVTPENISRETAQPEPPSMSTKPALTETQLKCSSLPPGLVPPDAAAAASKLNRSRSNAGSKSQEQFAAVEEDGEKEERSDKSFFERIFPRRSAKKRKSKEDKPPLQPAKRVESKPVAAPRSGAASRQRIQPIDLPPSPEPHKREPDCVLPKPSPEKTLGSSPLQAELETRFRQRQMSASLTPPQSPGGRQGETPSVIKVEVRRDSKSRMKIAGLSSLQQKVMIIGDELDDGGFKSLSDLPNEEAERKPQPVAKSQSFKTAERGNESTKPPVLKAASFDSLEPVKRDGEGATKPVVEEFKEPVVANFDLAAEIFNDVNNITISGPSHTAVVSVSSQSTDAYTTTNTKSETVTSGDKVKEVTTREAVSVTKIQLKRESTQITQSTVSVPKNAVPEFLNRQLNKVEAKPTSNVVFSTSSSPRIVDEQSRPKPVFAVPEPAKNVPRKFSQEDIEIVEKNEEDRTSTSSVTVVIQPRFKKNETKRKSSTSSTTPDSPSSDQRILRSRSVSLDSLKGEPESSDKSSQDSIDKIEEKSSDAPLREKTTSVAEPVVLRKKSLIKQKNDEEPELMKVFARRSLKLKDTESEAISQQVAAAFEDAKTRDSDKENQADSPQEERRRSSTNESKLDTAEPREPLTETLKEPKIKDSVNERKFIEVAEVTLRKPNNVYARAFSLNPPKVCDESKVKKQSSFNERRITDNWITNMKNGDDLIERKISQDEIITGISPKSDFISEELLTERKNFNQRKAEWEKRAQEAQKKSVP